MNRLTNADRCRVLACLVDGNSIRATVRITGIAKKTVMRLGVELGEACERFADKIMRNLPCVVAVKAAFLARSIDYGMLVKIYGDSAQGYSPAECIGARRESILGLPNVERICTSHAERNNLTMRMQMRRFTRLTNGFSKKRDNHRLACAVHFVHYNFARIHSSLRVTPAMAAGLTDHAWDLSEIIALLESEEALPLAA